VERQGCLLVEEADKGAITHGAAGPKETADDSGGPSTEKAYLGNRNQDSKKKKPWSRLKKAAAYTILGASLLWNAWQWKGKDIAEDIHRHGVRSQLEMILENTPAAIPYDRINDQNNPVPKWINNLTSFYYIEQLSYGNTIELIGSEMEIISGIREIKALLKNEIRFQFSNEKIQNHLYNPSNTFFGRDYESKEENFVNTVLSMLALSVGDFKGEFDRENIASFKEEQKKSLIEKVTKPKPSYKDPNPYYDSRCDDIIRNEISAPYTLRLAKSKKPMPGAHIISSDEEDELIKKIDSAIPNLNPEQRNELFKKGLVYLLENDKEALELGAVKEYVNAMKSKYINNRLLEIRLLMLETIYDSELLNHNPLPSFPYIYHLEGEPGINALMKLANDRNIMMLATEKMNTLNEEALSLNEKREDFISQLSESEFIGRKGLDDKEKDLSLKMLFESLRFDNVYKKIKGYSQYSVVMPYVGEFQLPVAELKIGLSDCEISPGGMFGANRDSKNRGSRPHMGTDFYGDLGELIFAMLDGKVTKIAQDDGAGNYIKIMHNGLTFTYQHLLQIPTAKNYEQMLTEEEYANYRELDRSKKRRNRGPPSGLRPALIRYASLVLNKSEKDITEQELNTDYLRERSLFYQLKERFDRGENIIVKKGQPVANMGRSGNVMNNTDENIDMKQPHLHIGSEVDLMKIIPFLKQNREKILDIHVNNKIFNDWMREKNHYQVYLRYNPDAPKLPGL
jgi:hypothetical protein